MALCKPSEDSLKCIYVFLWIISCNYPHLCLPILINVSHRQYILSMASKICEKQTDTKHLICENHDEYAEKQHEIGGKR